MTVFGIVDGVIVDIVLAFIVWRICDKFFDDNTVGKIITIVIGIILAVGVWFGIHWYFTNTASGLRAVKSQQSDFSNGIERQIIVYDMEGDIIEEYQGKFDVEYTDERILFDDENGCRHIIYFKTGTVIVNETGQKE